MAQSASGKQQRRIAIVEERVLAAFVKLVAGESSNSSLITRSYRRVRVRGGSFERCVPSHEDAKQCQTVSVYRTYCFRRCEIRVRDH